MAHVDEYGGDVVLEDWRLGIEPIAFDVKSGLPSEGIFRDALASWPMLDSIYYGGRSVDRVVNFVYSRINCTSHPVKNDIIQELFGLQPKGTPPQIPVIALMFDHMPRPLSISKIRG